MHGVAIEHWRSDKELPIMKWLTDTFGSSSKETWFADYDYDLQTLTMSDEIYTMYLLKWPEKP